MGIEEGWEMGEPPPASSGESIEAFGGPIANAEQDGAARHPYQHQVIRVLPALTRPPRARENP